MAKKQSDSKNDTSTSSTNLTAVPPSYDLRTQAGREQYDAAVTKALRKSPAGGIDSASLIVKVGGSPTQLRASLARLIDANVASKTGTTRATRYLAAATAAA